MINHKYIIYFIVTVTFFSDPYIWFKAFTSDYRLINIVLIGMSSIYILLKLMKKKVTWGRRDWIWFGSFLIVFLFMLIHGAVFSDSAQIIQSIGYLLKVLFMFNVLYFIKNHGLKLIDVLFKFNLFMIAGAVVLFFLLLVGINLPYIMFSQGDTGMLVDTNWLYPLGIIMDKYEIGSFIFSRANGMTDEPGQLALLITWLLILNELTIKSKVYRKYLIIGGLFTFSLAYFFSLILFSIYFIFKIEYVPKVITYSATSITIILISFSLVPENIQSIVKATTVERLQASETSSGKRFKGDNRSEALVTYFEMLKDDDSLLFGYGFSESEKKGASRLFAQFGFVGLMLIYLPVFVLLFSKELQLKDKYLILIIIINFIQRPGIHFIFQMMVLTLIFYWFIIKRHGFNGKIGRFTLEPV